MRINEKEKLKKEIAKLDAALTASKQKVQTEKEKNKNLSIEVKSLNARLSRSKSKSSSLKQALNEESKKKHQ